MISHDSRFCNSHHSPALRTAAVVRMRRGGTHRVPQRDRAAACARGRGESSSGQSASQADGQIMGLLFSIGTKSRPCRSLCGIAGGNVLNPERGVYLSTSKSMTGPCWIEGRPDGSKRNEMGTQKSNFSYWPRFSCPLSVKAVASLGQPFPKCGAFPCLLPCICR